MDTDISHAVEARLQAIEAQLQQLQEAAGISPDNTLPADAEEDKPGHGPKPADDMYDPDKPSEPVTKSTRSRS